MVEEQVIVGARRPAGAAKKLSLRWLVETPYLLWRRGVLIRLDGGDVCELWELAKPAIARTITVSLVLRQDMESGR